ncbi:MAG TPA: HAMP domain-containing sensor histidine kinase [Labilithrix sp.]
MSAAKTPTTPEREQTDESLRVERRKADDVEDAADAVIEKARARADDVITRGRARIDRAVGKDGRPGALGETVARERRLEDEAVQSERDEADEVLRKERAAGAAVLAQERGATDKDLSAERSRADYALATRDDFLAIVGHDLRNMLSTVIGYAALIAKVEADDPAAHSEEVVGYARRIERSGARMNRLVGDLVDVASIEAGALAVTLQPGDPRDVVREAIDNFQTHASSFGVTLTSELTAGPMRASFDPARVLQVLANLIGNALKFTRQGGHVTVRVVPERDAVRFEVHDTGIGIAASDVAVVFQRFHQVNTADRRGAGLGLYISKSIVQGHGGRIGVDSRPNEGSTFWFTLPVA